MAFRLGVAAIAIVGLGGGVGAHESASASGSLYTARYLVCGQRPRQDVRCAGLEARSQLLVDLTGGSPSRGGRSSEDLVHQAAIWSVYFHVAEAIPPLRDHLARAPQPADHGTHRAMTLNGLRGEAAYALAHLGDATSAPAIADLLVDFETTGHGSLWQDTLAALAVIDAPRASRYAIEFLGRSSNFKLSLPGGSSKLKALEYIRRDDARTALPVLEKLAQQTEKTDDHAHCQLMATRVRLDDQLRASVRKQLLGNYSGTWLPLCAEPVFAQLGSPADPADAAALLRHTGRDDRGMDFGMANLAYQRILDVLASQPVTPATRQALQMGLVDRSAWSHVANPKHRNYSLHFVVLHHAALAGLGLVDSRVKLYDLIDDPNDRGHAWLAALWALRLNLRDNQQHVGELLSRAPRQAQQETRGVFEDIRKRVLDEFVARYPSDPRWTVMVLDLDKRMLTTPSLAAERALYHLSRRAPQGTCEQVTSAAASLPDYEATEFGLLALTALGDSCRGSLARLADDQKATPQARGSALELLGAVRDPQLAKRIERASRTGVWKPAVERARAWLVR